MDYGCINKAIGRKVGKNFWGTRSEHIVGVAAALAVADHGSAAIFQNYLGKAISFAETPAAFIAHTFFSIYFGVILYVAGKRVSSAQICFLLNIFNLIFLYLICLIQLMQFSTLTMLERECQFSRRNYTT